MPPTPAPSAPPRGSADPPPAVAPPVAPPGVPLGAPGHAPVLVLLPPPPDLAAHVEYLWQLVLAGGAPAGTRWRVVADGYVDLAVRTPLDAEPLQAVVAAPWRLGARRAAVEFLASAPAVVCSAATAARALAADRPLLVTGARFRLGAVPSVLRAAAADLVDGARPLGDVLDGRAADAVWRARADDAPRHVTGYGCGAPPGPGRAAAERVLREIARASAVAAVRRLVARIEARRRGDAADPRLRGALALLDRAVADPAVDAGGGAPLARLCREVAVSRRTLERVFAEQLGLAPRTYFRLRRVGAVAEALERAAREASAGGAGGAASLTEVAHRVGYADHAHMTREFGRVMGTTPSAYRREAALAPVVRRLAGPVAFDRATPLGTLVPPDDARGPGGPAGADAEVGAGPAAPRAAA